MLSDLTTAVTAPMLGVLSQPAMMVDVAAKLAPMASLVLFLAPLPTIQKVSKDKQVGDLPLLPYSSMAVSGFLWTTYGLLKSQPSVWASNGIGMMLALFYSIQFSRFAPRMAPTLPGSLKQHRNGALLIAVAALIAAATRSTGIVGIMCVGICLALFGSPLAAVKTVISNKSAASIPLPLSLATTVNCFLWSVVGIFDLKDMNVIVPNSIGLALGMFQLCLKFIYRSGPVKILPEPAMSEDLVFEKNRLLNENYAFIGKYDVHTQDGQYPVQQEEDQTEDRKQPESIRNRVPAN